MQSGGCDEAAGAIAHMHGPSPIVTRPFEVFRCSRLRRTRSAVSSCEDILPLKVRGHIVGSGRGRRTRRCLVSRPGWPRMPPVASAQAHNIIRCPTLKRHVFLLPVFVVAQHGRCPSSVSDLHSTTLNSPTLAHGAGLLPKHLFLSRGRALGQFLTYRGSAKPSPAA
jgi:hypothetical protein